MFKIINNLLEKEMMYDGVTVLKYHIEYPSIIINYYDKGIIKFNTYNQELANKLKEKSENELYKEAVELYKFNKQNGYPIMVYEIYRIYQITLNVDNTISLYADEYIYSGGAHGNTIRTSQTWNLIYGRMMELAYFYRDNPYFLLDILKSINEQILKNPEIYFGNACNLVLNTFNPNNFYLIPKETAIYFQQYDIAPYSSGIRVFNVKRTENNVII